MKRKSPEGSQYPKDWKEIAQAVKDAAGWKCVRCSHRHEPETGYTLTVHHLDINPANCAWWNLAPLCQRCHLSIQGKVIMHRDWMFDHSEWFQPYVAAYYGVRAGLLPRTFDYFDSLIMIRREFVISNLDYLLSLGKAYQEREQVIIQKAVDKRAAIMAVFEAAKAKAASNG
jgi:hypothetical protein